MRFFKGDSTDELRPSHALGVAWSGDVADYVTSLSVSADGSLIAVGNAAGEVHVLDAGAGAVRFRLSAHGEGLLTGAWSPTRNVLATGGQDGFTRLHDGQGDKLGELPGGAPWVEHVAWSPDGTKLATSAGRIVRIWNQRGGPLVESEEHESTVTGLAWNRKGTQLATACYGGVRIFNIGSSAPARHLPWKGSLVSLSWSPNGEVIACGTQERSVHFWRLTKQRESEMSGFAAKPRALVWDSESKLLATGGDRSIGVWAFEGKGPEGRAPIELVGHQALCTALAFHPKLTRLASGADDTGVIVWEPRRLQTPVGFGFLEETVTSVAWVGQGRLLVASDAAGTVRAFRADHIVATELHQ